MLAYTSPMPVIRRLLLLPPVALLVACGQTGALYLPDQGVETPVEVRTSTPAPAPTPPPEPEDKDKEKNGDQPGGP